MKATPKIGKVSSINLVDETSELMVISQFGKIIRIDTKSIRAAGRSTQGVKLLDLEPQDKVAAAVVIPPEVAKTQPEEGTLLQYFFLARFTPFSLVVLAKTGCRTWFFAGEFVVGCW
jgi:DNA gyrase subunit A